MWDYKFETCDKEREDWRVEWKAIIRWKRTTSTFKGFNYFSASENNWWKSAVFDPPLVPAPAVFVILVEKLRCCNIESTIGSCLGCRRCKSIAPSQFAILSCVTDASLCYVFFFPELSVRKEFRAPRKTRKYTEKLKIKNVKNRCIPSVYEYKPTKPRIRL